MQERGVYESASLLLCSPEEEEDEEEEEEVEEVEEEKEGK